MVFIFIVNLLVFKATLSAVPIHVNLNPCLTALPTMPAPQLHVAINCSPGKFTVEEDEVRSIPINPVLVSRDEI